MGKQEQITELKKQLSNANIKGTLGYFLLIIGTISLLLFPMFGIISILIGAILAIIAGSSRRKIKYELAKLI